MLVSRLKECMCCVRGGEEVVYVCMCGWVFDVPLGLLYSQSQASLIAGRL